MTCHCTPRSVSICPAALRLAALYERAKRRAWLRDTELDATALIGEPVSLVLPLPPRGPAALRPVV